MLVHESVAIKIKEYNALQACVLALRKIARQIARHAPHTQTEKAALDKARAALADLDEI